MKILLNCEGEQEFEVDASDTFEVLKLQVLSLSGIDPEDQLFSVDEIALEDPVSKLDLKDGQRLFVRRKSAAIAVDPYAFSGCCTQAFFPGTPIQQPLFDLSKCYHCSNVCSSGGTPRRCPARGFVCSCPKCRTTFVAVKHEAKAELKLALRSAAEEQGSQFQRFPEKERHFQAELRRISDHVKLYEAPSALNAARRCLPLEKLATMARTDFPAMFSESPKDALARALLRWFKTEFFTWVNQPACTVCQGKTEMAGMSPPLPMERAGRAGRVEVYRCKTCLSFTRFPRYNDPVKLLQTRRGRCGEYANAFCLCCRALGLDTRYVLDFTDHVWTEVYSDYLKRWIHLDSCEDAWDKPKLYSGGWKKKLTYVLAASRSCVADVSRRYATDWVEQLKRRDVADEGWIQDQVERAHKFQLGRSSLSEEKLEAVRERYEAEREALERDGVKEEATQEGLGGRESGSVAWRRERGELGVVQPPLVLEEAVEAIIKSAPGTAAAVAALNLLIKIIDGVLTSEESRTRSIRRTNKKFSGTLEPVLPAALFFLSAMGWTVTEDAVKLEKEDLELLKRFVLSLIFANRLQWSRRPRLRGGEACTFSGRAEGAREEALHTNDCWMRQGRMSSSACRAEIASTKASPNVVALRAAKMAKMASPPLCDL